ncbi:hypothetical protein BDQ17DRAFT_1324028 [Cyathus striatus]|nr:hypothetical protein BDQ17DRAFT_1324028 [Cyathus striatus]
MKTPVKTLVTILQHTQVYHNALIYNFAKVYQYCELGFIGILFYHHFALNIPPESCVKAFKANGWMYFSGGVLAEAILSIRTWSVWNDSPTVKFGLPIFFLSICTLPSVPLPTLTYLTVALNPYHPGLRGCVITHGSSILSVVWVLLTVFNGGYENFYDAGLVALILMGVWAFQSRQMGVTLSLMRIVYQDGITYYFYLFGKPSLEMPLKSLALINTVLVLKLPPDFVALLLYLTSLERAMHAIFSCRVIFHIRDRGEMSLGDGTLL